MNKKKVLVFIDWFYPGFRAGGPVRSCYNVIENLSGEFDFMVVTRDTDYLEENPMPGIRANQWMRHENGMNVYYISARELHGKTIEKILSDVNPDLVWLNGIYSKWFTLVPLRKWKGKVIVSVRGMLAPEALKIKRTKKRIFLSVARLTGLFRRAIFHATNEKEKEQVTLHFPASKVMIAPNFPVKEHPAGRRKKKEPGAARLVSIARIAPEKNIHSALLILNHLAMKDLEGGEMIEFDLFGAVYDQKYFEECKRLVSDLPSNIRVSFKGSIDPSEVAETLSQYDFFFSPTGGENYGHAIIQAMSCGLPVIISDATPWRDLEKKGAGWDISMGPEVREYRKVLKKCIGMDEHEFAVLSSRAQHFAAEIQNDPRTLVLNRNLFNT